MSTSVNSGSSNLAIDLRRDGRHRVSSLDADGDGVADGQSLGGDSGKMHNVVGTGQAVQLAQNRSASTGSASRILADRGMELNTRGLQSRDGFTARDVNARAALDFGGPPTLPENTTHTLRAGAGAGAGTINTTASNGNINAAAAAANINGAALRARAVDVSTRSTASDFEGRLSDYVNRTGGEDASLMWTSLSVMARTSIIDTHMASEIKSLMQKGKVESKKNEIKATEEQIQAEREAALMNLMFAIAAAVVQIALGMNPATAAIGQALGQLIKSLGEYINKTSGPQREADDKKIEVMRHQMMQEIFEQGIENAKSNYDEARELLKLAIKILTEHAERQTQITTTITRT